MTTTNAQWVNGNYVYYRKRNRKSWIDACGDDVVKYIDDFTSVPVDDTTGDPTAWTMTVVEAGAGNTTVTSANISGGALLITTDDAENDGANIQLNGESFKLTADTKLSFNTRFKVSDATQSDIFIGLAITDTDILGGVTDRIGFECLDGSTDLKFMLEKNNTETLSAAIATLADDTFIDVDFHWDGSAIEVFVNNVSVSTPVVTNLPNDEELRVSVQFLAGAAAAKTATVDRIRVIQIGRAA